MFFWAEISGLELWDAMEDSTGRMSASGFQSPSPANTASACNHQQRGVIAFRTKSAQIQSWACAEPALSYPKLSQFLFGG